MVFGQIVHDCQIHLALRIQLKHHINFIVKKEPSRQKKQISSRTLANVFNSRVSAALYICALPRS